MISQSSYIHFALFQILTFETFKIKLRLLQMLHFLPGLKENLRDNTYYL